MYNKLQKLVSFYESRFKKIPQRLRNGNNDKTVDGEAEG